MVKRDMSAEENWTYVVIIALGLAKALENVYRVAISMTVQKRIEASRKDLVDSCTATRTRSYKELRLKSREDLFSRPRPRMAM